MITIHPSSISGSFFIPTSKSHSLRALFLSSFSNGVCTIDQMLDSSDTIAMQNCLSLFGVTFKKNGSKTIVDSRSRVFYPSDVLNVGNSGIALRFLTAAALLSDRYTIITGDESLRSRPMGDLLSGITQLGGFGQSATCNQKAPILIKGLPSRGSCTLEGRDSQPVSALLFSASFFNSPTEIRVTNPGEVPWIDLTLDWMKRCKLPYERDGYERYWIPGGSRVDPFEYTVPGDWSSAAFPLALGIVHQSTVTILGVDSTDVQGDKVIIDILRSLGAQIVTSENSATLYPSKLSGGEIDMEKAIDALPILSVLGCFCSSPLSLRNAAIARTKESDRIHVITNELRKMGARITEHEDGLTIYPSSLFGANLYSFGDHRIAMSLIVAASRASGESQLSGIECIRKTYPSFISDVRANGGIIR